LAVFIAQLPVFSGQAAPSRGLSFAFSFSVLLSVVRRAR
jgi:hypothetical protein